MAQLSSSASPSLRRRSDASATESLFFFVSERNQQEVRHTGTGPGTDRSKRWTWGGAGEEVVSFLTPPPTDQPINKQHQQLSNSTTIVFSPEKVSFNNKKKMSVSNRRSVSGLPEERHSGETLNSPVRSSSFRANSKSPASTPKRGKSNRKRAQTHCSGQATPPQPHHRATTPEVKGHSTLDRKNNEKKIQKSTSRENNAGMTDAEEASRVLMEKRRLAREQKEEQSRRSQQEVKDQPETVRQEDEERSHKEQRWKEMQEQLDRDREMVVLRVKCEAQKKENEMKKQHLQAEKERQQRKKRIDEIMKRTRKSDVESPTTESVCHVTPEDVTLGQLNNVCVEELSDGVQSMDVSPVSRDEQPSVRDFSLAEDTVGVPVPLDQSGCAAPGLGSTPSLVVGVLNRNLIVTSH